VHSAWLLNLLVTFVNMITVAYLTVVYVCEYDVLSLSTSCFNAFSILFTMLSVIRALLFIIHYICWFGFQEEKCWSIKKKKNMPSVSLSFPTATCLGWPFTTFIPHHFHYLCHLFFSNLFEAKAHKCINSTHNLSFFFRTGNIINRSGHWFTL